MADKNFPGAKITELRIDREKASRMCNGFVAALLDKRTQASKGPRARLLARRDVEGSALSLLSCFLIVAPFRSHKCMPTPVPDEQRSLRHVAINHFLCIFRGDSTVPGESSAASQNSKNYHTMRNDETLCAHSGRLRNCLAVSVVSFSTMTREAAEGGRTFLSPRPHRPSEEDDAKRAI